MGFVRTKPANLRQDFVWDDVDDSEIGSPSAHHQPLTDAIEALEAKEPTMALSTQASTSSDHSYISNRTQSLGLINQANLTNNVTGLEAALGTLTYASIKSTFKLQQLIDGLKSALFKRLKDISAWIRAHPYRAFGVFSGITILGLTCAIPVFLELVGFGALGPVAGSIATGWHSSLGLVAAGTPFAFLQSAAMGGAAMGAITGIGVLSNAITIAVALTTKKRTIGGLMSSCKRAVGGAVKKFKSFFE
ncbi:MAG: hypothetical protein Q9191_002598 [Dirinaria sp. TL-2023a]